MTTTMYLVRMPMSGIIWGSRGDGMVGNVNYSPRRCFEIELMLSSIGLFGLHPTKLIIIKQHKTLSMYRVGHITDVQLQLIDFSNIKEDEEKDDEEEELWKMIVKNM